MEKCQKVWLRKGRMCWLRLRCCLKWCHVYKPPYIMDHILSFKLDNNNPISLFFLSTLNFHGNWRPKMFIIRLWQTSMDVQRKVIINEFKTSILLFLHSSFFSPFLRALYQLHLVKATTARACIPKELRLVEAFGYFFNHCEFCLISLIIEDTINGCVEIMKCGWIDMI